MEITAKRRDIIKNITIIFLVIMLVLTFFSSTIMNRSLPEVAAQYAYSGQITTSVRATGTTEANANYQVILEEGRVIRSVEVRRGDSVQAGDLLFTLEEGESTEMQAALDKLAQAQLDYDKWQLQVQADLEDAEREIRYETEDLAKIKARGVSGGASDAAQDKVEQLETKLATYKRADAAIAYELAGAALDKAEAAYDAANEVYEQKNEVYSNLQNSGSAQDQLVSAERNIEDMTIDINRTQEEYDALKAEHETLLAQRETLERELNLARARYYDNSGSAAIIADNIAMYQAEVERLSSLPNPTEEDLEALANAKGQLAYYQSAQSNMNSQEAISSADLNEAQAAYDANESKIAQTESQLKSMEQDLEDKNRTLDRAKTDYEKLKLSLGASDTVSGENYTAALKTAKDELRAAEDVREDAQDVLSDAQTEYNTAKAAYDAAKQSGKKTDQTYTREELEKLILSTEAELEAARDQLNSISGSSSDAYPSYSAYNEAITAQQRTIDNLKTALARKKESNALDEPTYTEAISRAQKEVDRLSETVGGTEIFAKVAGTINNISVSAGQEIDAQTVLAEIEQQDRGYTVELSMTVEQSKRIAVGQAATILYYWGTTPEAVVESIQPSKSDPQNTRIVTLLLNGDITAGQSFTFSLGERSANSDSVVPSSAIREDSNGKFVLVVEAKNTPIGNRYTAVRRDVEIIAEDDTNAAVSGLTGGEFVITTSTTPISAGQQVRLSDN